jgi:hypothetical protein
MAEEKQINPSVRYERRDVNIRGVLLFILGLVIAAILMHVSLRWLFDDLKARSIITPKNFNVHGTQSILPPEPRLQLMPGHEEQPAQEMKAMIREQDSILENYGWVDSAKGIARIPIEEAKKILIERTSQTKGTNEK